METLESTNYCPESQDPIIEKRSDDITKIMGLVSISRKNKIKKWSCGKNQPLSVNCWGDISIVML